MVPPATRRVPARSAIQTSSPKPSAWRTSRTGSAWSYPCSSSSHPPGFKWRAAPARAGSTRPLRCVGECHRLETQVALRDGRRRSDVGGLATIMSKRRSPRARPQPRRNSMRRAPVGLGVEGPRERASLARWPSRRVGALAGEGDGDGGRPVRGEDVVADPHSLGRRKSVRGRPKRARAAFDERFRYLAWDQHAGAPGNPAVELAFSTRYATGWPSARALTSMSPRVRRTRFTRIGLAGGSAVPTRTCALQCASTWAIVKHGLLQRAFRVCMARVPRGSRASRPGALPRAPVSRRGRRP